MSNKARFEFKSIFNFTEVFPGAFHCNITTVTMKLAHMLTIRRGIVNWIRFINLKKSLKDLFAWANEGLQNNVAITLIEGGMESWRAKQ